MDRPRYMARDELSSIEDMRGEHELDPLCEGAAQRAYHEMLAKGASPLEAHGVALRIYRYHVAGHSSDRQERDC